MRHINLTPLLFLFICSTINAATNYYVNYTCEVDSGTSGDSSWSSEVCTPVSSVPSSALPGDHIHFQMISCTGNPVCSGVDLNVSENAIDIYAAGNTGQTIKTLTFGNNAFGSASADFPDVFFCFPGHFFCRTSINYESYTIPAVSTDSDSDGFIDSNDNCPEHINPDQLDMDNDTIGNACDSTEGNFTVDGTYKGTVQKQVTQ